MLPQHRQGRWRWQVPSSTSPPPRGTVARMERQTRTGGRILVDQLLAQGCERIFTVPGESFLAVLDALHDTPQIETVVCR